MIYRDSTIKFTQLYRFIDGEWYEEIKEDLENLLELGVQIESITCDGHKAIIKAINQTCTDVILQRCIVHIQRQCRIWLSNKPKTVPGKQLRSIISKVHLIENTLERDYWIVRFYQWYQEHKSYINQKTINPGTGRYWYTHKMVRRSFVLIKKALPNMFYFIDNSRISKSTNGIESFFGHLKGHLNIHRGLSQKHRKGFIKWYLYFKNYSSIGFMSHKAKRMKKSPS